jgi:hypothetical protein
VVFNQRKPNEKRVTYISRKRDELIQLNVMLFLRF